MLRASTEDLHPAAIGLDTLPHVEILQLLLSQQIDSLSALSTALPAIADGATMMADAVLGGGRLVYAGAGSSALMANADAAELPGTFGFSPADISVLMAGGVPEGANMPGQTEDDTDEARRASRTIRPGDVVIAVTASGSTPYAVAVARAAKATGARVIAIANNSGAPVFALADVAICLPTPPELIAGSTRMGAGTAQKAALNLMSTLMAVTLGHVHDGMMVSLVADNQKLRCRAEDIVSRIAQVRGGDAAAALDAAGGVVKNAILVAKGASPDGASRTLRATGGNLRKALAHIGNVALKTGHEQPTKGVMK